MVGLRALFEGIDNRADFKSFMQNYAVAHVASTSGASNSTRVLKRFGPTDEGYVSDTTGHLDSTKGSFGLAPTDTTAYTRIIESIRRLN